MVDSVASPTSRRPRRERPRGRGEEARRSRAALLLLSASIIGSALAIGAVHPRSLAAVVALAAAALALLVVGAHRAGEGLRVPFLARLFAGLAAFTSLQAIPIPASLLARLAPGNADVWARALSPLGLEPGAWAPISLDPGATWMECLKLVLYAVTCVVAANLRAEASTVLAVVVISASTVAVTTLAHGLVGARVVFGVYEPSFGVTDWHVGPLLNSNTLAGYTNLGALTAVGLLASSRSPARRAALGLAAATMMAINLRAGSRGGLLALGFGCAVFAGAAWLVGRRRGGDRAETRVALASVGAVTAVAAVFLFAGGTRHAFGELDASALQKLAIVRWVWPMAQAHPWLGIGRGSFESVFEAWRPERDGNTVFTHAENFPAQWASEWGLPVGAAAVLGLLWAVRPRALGAHRTLTGASVFAGIAAVLLQNLVDLGLEIPALPIALAACVGALSGREWSRLEEAGAASRSRWLPPALAASAVPLLGAALVVASPVADERRALKARFDAVGRDADARAAFRRELEAAMRRHPAEGYFSLLGGTLALEAGDESPGPWLERALERTPTSGRVHLLASFVLARARAREQALLELELAMRYDADLVPPACRLAIRLARSEEELLAVVPAGRRAIVILDRLSGELSARGEVGDAELALALDFAAIGRDPGALGALSRVGGALLAALETDPETPTATLQCPEPARCRADVEAIAASLERAAPDASAAPQLLARLDVVGGRLEDALSRLERDCQRPRDQGACLALRVHVAERLLSVQTGRARSASGPASPAGRFERAIKDFVGAECAEPVRCAEAHTRAGDACTRVGLLASAAHHYGRAAHDDPREERWRTLAAAAERAGLVGPAMEAKRHLPGTPTPDALPP